MSFPATLRPGLVWRDLAYWQRSIFPQMRDKPIRAHYEGQSWNSDPVALRRWQTGQTGFPLVDAGMRELWTTGWMAQNVRMAAAILLCEHLNIHWVEGENCPRTCPGSEKQACLAYLLTSTSRFICLSLARGT